MEECPRLARPPLALNFYKIQLIPQISLILNLVEILLELIAVFFHPLGWRGMIGFELHTLRGVDK